MGASGSGGKEPLTKRLRALRITMHWVKERCSHVFLIALLDHCLLSSEDTFLLFPSPWQQIIKYLVSHC